MMKSDKERIGEILTQTIVSLCNSGLQFNTELTVEGLLGITLDKADVFLVNIKEVVSLCETQTEPADDVSDTSSDNMYPRGMKRKYPEPSVGSEHLPNASETNVNDAGIPDSFKRMVRTDMTSTESLEMNNGISSFLPNHNSILDVKHEASRLQYMGQKQVPYKHFTLPLAPESQQDVQPNIERPTQISPVAQHDVQTPPKQFTSPQHAVTWHQYGSSNPEPSASHLQMSGSRDNAISSQDLQHQGLAIPKEEPEYSEADYGALPLLETGSQELTDLSSSGHDLFMPELQTQSQDVSTGLDSDARTQSQATEEQHSRPLTQRSQEEDKSAKSYTQRQYNDNTLKCTLSNVRIVRRWLVEQKGETREVQEIPVPHLNEYLKEMWMSIRKQNGSEYGGSTLKYLKIHLNLYLMAQTNGRVSLNTKDFAEANLMWERKWKSLTAAEALWKPNKPSPKESGKKPRKASRDRSSLSEHRTTLKEAAAIAQGNLEILATQAQGKRNSTSSSRTHYQQPAAYNSSENAQSSPLPPVHETAHSGSLQRVDSDGSVHRSPLPAVQDLTQGTLSLTHVTGMSLPTVPLSNQPGMDKVNNGAEPPSPQRMLLPYGHVGQNSRGLNEHLSSVLHSGSGRVLAHPACLPQTSFVAAGQYGEPTPLPAVSRILLASPPHSGPVSFSSAPVVVPSVGKEVAVVGGQIQHDNSSPLPPVSEIARVCSALRQPENSNSDP